MTEALNAQRQAPQSGTATSVVIFVHGYGADGADLLGLSEPLAPHMPDTVFYAPDAPERCAGNPFGYQWFPLPWMDGSSEEAAAESLARSADLLNAFIDDTLNEEGLTADRLILFGFSQGTMLSLHIAFRRDAPPAGVVGFSGRLLDPENTLGSAVSKPPVLLVHGDADDIVPVTALQEAGQALSAAGVETYAHVMKGTAHGIAPDGLSVALAFMHDKLGMS